MQLCSRLGEPYLCFRNHYELIFKSVGVAFKQLPKNFILLFERSSSRRMKITPRWGRSARYTFSPNCRACAFIDEEAHLRRLDRQWHKIRIAERSGRKQETSLNIFGF